MVLSSRIFGIDLRDTVVSAFCCDRGAGVVPPVWWESSFPFVLASVEPMFCESGTVSQMWIQPEEEEEENEYLLVKGGLGERELGWHLNNRGGS